MSKKKILAVIAAAALAVSCVVAGTLAWLTAESETITNTFTVGDINISLKEHVYDETSGLTSDIANGGNTYGFVPGDTLSKDPFVTVEAGSKACWLFIHVKEENNTYTGLEGKIIGYTVDTGWKSVTGHEGFYYREVAATAETTAPMYILANNQVTVNGAITKEMVDGTSASASAVPGIESLKPQLIFTAAAVQKDNVANVEDAWKKLPAAFTGVTADEPESGSEP